MTGPVNYEIREATHPEGGLLFELWVEGHRVGTASATDEVIDAMSMIGEDRTSVAEDLKESLVDLLTGQLELVSLGHMQEDPNRPLVFRTPYQYKDRDRILAGVAWYNVSTGVTGPDDAPAVVRNKLRHEVHRRLTTPQSHARAIVELHD